MSPLCLPPSAPSLRSGSAPSPSVDTPGFWTRVWQRLRTSERDAYLARSTDLADLERRMRAWDGASADASLLKISLWT